MKWFREVKHHSPNGIWLLVGTKLDLKEDPQFIQKLEVKGEHPVQLHEAQLLAKEIGAYKFIECSAKTGARLKSVFDHAIRAALHGSMDSNKKRQSGCILL